MEVLTCRREVYRRVVDDNDQKVEQGGNCDCRELQCSWSKYGAVQILPLWISINIEIEVPILGHEV